MLFLLRFAVLSIVSMRILCAPAAMAKTPSPKPGRLLISDNNRFLTDAQGTPFFWLADTAWELFHRLNREQADHYLSDRAAKGYTVIQAVVLAELNGLNAPNAYGHAPLQDNDPLKPSEDYFRHVDFIVQRANELGLVIGMLPTWGDKWLKKWGEGPEIFNEKNAEAYAQWLAKRYKNAGLVWILGGDRPIENEAHKQITRAMAKGLRAGDEGAHLITVHVSGGSSSADWFHDEPWLDFNMRQNGHVAEYVRYEKTRQDYERPPAKPVVDGEPIYEDHPISFKASDFGYSVAADVRRALYWDLFAGAFGHTYGHHSVWQMWSPPHAPINNPLMTWDEALKQPGAGQMQHARWLLQSRPFLSRIPDDSVVISDSVATSVPGAGRYKFAATRDAQGSFAMVYAPVGRRFRVRMDVIKGKRVKAWWFDPRNGKARAAGSFAAVGEREFVSPNPGELLDWVLVLDDAAAGHPPPGARKPRAR
jgi:hypothetical protein